MKDPTQDAVDRFGICRWRRDGRKNARTRLVCNDFESMGAVAAVAAGLRSRHAGFWLWVFVARQELALRRIPSVLTVPILGQGSRSDNLRESRQFLVGAVIGD
jgi:hypothetical protein